MKQCIINIDSKIEPLRKLAARDGEPLVLLVIRLFIAEIFFRSGWLKLQNFMNGDWQSTIDGFTDLYPVPGIPPSIAAIFGTAGELGLPILLVFGLCGRFAALGLMAMTCVIQFLVPPEYEIANPEHYYWLMLLAVIVVRGPGTLSLDHLLRRWLRRG